MELFDLQTFSFPLQQKLIKIRKYNHALTLKLRKEEKIEGLSSDIQLPRRSGKYFAETIRNEVDEILKYYWILRK